MSDLGAQSADQPQPPPPPEFSLSRYREQGSLWAWSARPYAPRFSPIKGTIRGLSCYQYTPAGTDPVISNVKLEESGIGPWLDATVPLNEGNEPCAGYKILQIEDARFPEHIAMKSETFMAITQAFGLPPVELHVSSKLQGGCGMFLQEDGSFGMNQIRI